MVTEDRAKTDWLSGNFIMKNHAPPRMNFWDGLPSTLSYWAFYISIAMNTNWEIRTGCLQWSWTIPSHHETRVVRYLREFVHCTEPQCTVKSPELFGTCWLFFIANTVKRNICSTVSSDSDSYTVSGISGVLLNRWWFIITLNFNCNDQSC